MKRSALLVLALLLFVGSVFAASVSIPYGGRKDLSLELNRDTTELLTVTITDIPDSNVSYITVHPSYDLRGRVFCAPSPAKVESSSQDFTCVVVPGDAINGDVYFSAFDVNDVHLKDTVLHLDVKYREVWYTGKALARVGSTITVGSYNIEVKKASFLYVLLSVGNSPVTAFINDETKIADDLYVTYKGFDPDTKEVFLEFRASFPVSVSVQEKQYYLVAPKVIYGEDNTYEIPVITNCSGVQYRLKGSDEWLDASLEDGKLVLETNSDRVYLRCKDDDSVSTAVYLKPALVIVKKEEVNASDFCPAHGYVEKSTCELSPERKREVCAAWAAANNYVQVPPGYEICKRSSGPSGMVWVVLGVLALLGLVWAFRTGKIRIPRRPSSEPPAPIEEKAERAVEDATGVLR